MTTATAGLLAGLLLGVVVRHVGLRRRRRRGGRVLPIVHRGVFLVVHVQFRTVYDYAH